jgi:hypothetical protein
MTTYHPPVTTHWEHHLTPTLYSCTYTLNWLSTSRLRVSRTPPWRLKHMRLNRGVWEFCYYVWAMRAHETYNQLETPPTYVATFRWPRWQAGTSRWIRLQTYAVGAGENPWRNAGPIMQIYIPPGPEPVPCATQIVNGPAAPPPPPLTLEQDLWRHWPHPSPPTMECAHDIALSTAPYP